MSEIEKLQEEINFLKKKLFKSESDLKGSLERVASFREKYEKGLSYNKELESQLKKLSQEIQLYRSKEKDGVSIGIQVADSDPELVSAKLVVKTDAGRIPTDIDMAPSVPVKAEVEVNIADKQVEPMSLAESLKAAAEEVVQNSGYVFDEKSGMYYDYNTGYYYDNEKALYYDPASGTYFYYDHAASEYKFHSQVSAHQYTTDSHYTDLDAASGGKDDSSRKADGRERDLLSSKSRHRRKADVPDEQEWNGREFKHKKKKSHKRDGENEKHKKKKKKRERNEDDIRRHRKKRKREKEDRDEKSSKRKKKSTKQEKKEKKRDNTGENDKQDKVVGIEQSDSRKDNDDNDAEPKCKEACDIDDAKGKSKDREFGHRKLDRSKKREELISKNSGKAGHDYKDCDIFGDIVLKKESKTGPMIVDVHDSPERNEKTPQVERKEMELIEISSSESDLEEGEISDITTISSSSSSVSSSCEEESDLETDPPMIVEEENSKAWPPCIRAMVKSSDKLDRGSLFLVTCTGATIGREKDLGHTILIEDVLISKMHAELKYNEEFKRYVVIDHASQNGTFVNGDRVCEPKVMGEAKTLFHGDELRVGSTTLELHIHPGTDTCEGCEPGLVLAQIKQEEKHAAADAKVLGKEEKELLRRKQLKNIKRKFGLENLSYVDDMSAINNPKYQDKATERRRTKGSDNPYQKDDAPASVDRAISHENKGHKLLQKMGWSEGESLGKSKQKGLKEPIKVNIRSTPQAGLGSGLNIATSLDNVHDVKKRELWSKMQQRYTKVEGQKEPAPVSDHGGWVSGGVVMDASLDDSQTETTAQPEDVSGDVDKDLGVQAGTSGVLEIQETDILYL
ncbi:angiogenic factor with G patch and FHA domains 1-like isoform X1 [Lineus longissimus]|uniref:angiogenic factor with G patch and FHA domains 1-like isoform X1 n=1 Tax=Lineus longissimus TaxID=88925 RepID=UPI002B4C8D36